MPYIVANWVLLEARALSRAVILAAMESSVARNVAWLRLLRFHLKFALRQARRFHRRFTFRQILGFYIGVPAAISLILCLVFLLWKPPKGVTPDLVSSRKPSPIELIQQIQAALGAHNPRAAHAAVAGLQEFYPMDMLALLALKK